MLSVCIIRSLLGYVKYGVQMLSCWKGKFHSHSGGKIWKAVTLCIMWAIWRERNNRTFDGVEHLIHVVKKSMLRCLYEQKTTLGSIPSCHFFRFH